MKTFARSLLLCALFAFISSATAYSQTWDEYKKTEQEQLAKFKIQQDKELAKLANEFNEYVIKADKEFAAFLQKEWEAYNAFKGLPIPERPKPVAIPVADAKAINTNTHQQKISAIKPRTVSGLAPIIPVLPIIQKTESPVFLKASVQVDYYGASASLTYDEEMSKNPINRIDEHSIAEWWTNHSNTNYNTLINELLTIKNEKCLNDYGYFLLVNKTTATLAANKANEAKLLSWFIMIKSGYNIKVAFNNDQIFLVFPSVNELYGHSFLMINNQQYYFVDEVEVQEFQSYDFEFPGAVKAIDFNIYQPLNIGDDVLERQVKFVYKEKEISFPVLLNANTLFFLKDYPVASLSIFFNAAMSRETKQSLAEGLMPLIHNMAENEALNLLLAFVQNAFIYQTDQQQFNKEKFFFPEELFFYSGSDCEDRSALFAYLVKQLLHLDVIGLEYDGHVATAVASNSPATGDYLVFDNRRYIIADPTYINAPLGLTMPKYKNAVPKVIETNNIGYLTNESDMYWELANKSGGFRGSNLNDARRDSLGNWYLTGYYTKEVSFADQEWKSDGKRRPFIVKFNSNKKVVWARTFETDGFSSGFALTLDVKGNPVIAGSFRGNLNAFGTKVSTKSDKEDIFVAGFEANGDLKWLQKSGLDTMDYSRFLNYVIKFSQNGKHQSTKLYLDNALNTSRGIFNIDNSFTLVGGVNFAISYMADNLAFESEGNFNTINYLKEESDALIQAKVNKSIAGLCAVINLIKSSGMVIPGKEAQRALDKYNPTFKTTSPSIYANIGNVAFMKNDEGIIEVQTNNNKSVSFDKVKISNGAKLKIISLNDGSEQVDVLSGIEVGKAFVWYDLNFVKLMPFSGDLLFDYDSDHTQKIINMKEDILD
jgi:hypothetical protein